MVERHRGFTILTHSVLILGAVVIVFPIYLAFVASTHEARDVMQSPVPLLPGHHFLDTYWAALAGTNNSSVAAGAGRTLLISLATALIIAVGKIVLSLLSAFAIVYFRFPLRNLAFALIFVTLMLPVEVRIGPTYDVVAKLGLINTLGGLSLPLIASATATFLFRQFFLTVPDELLEAALIDGASPWRFLWDILVPLSKTTIAALFVIQFIYGWNQYLWPLIAATSEDMYPIVIGLRRMIGGGESPAEWNVVMATAILAMLPPLAVLLIAQRHFVRGLVDLDK
jgi:sn-glycerol 3-phosphate transport system permease protein